MRAVDVWVEKRSKQFSITPEAFSANFDNVLRKTLLENLINEHHYRRMKDGVSYAFYEMKFRAKFYKEIQS